VIEDHFELDEPSAVVMDCGVVIVTDSENWSLQLQVLTFFLHRVFAKLGE
jgi:hypothetical protein